MQVTSLFAIFAAFLTLVAPLATLAMQINVPTNITTGKTTISCSRNANDSVEPLTFFLVRNGTQDKIAEATSAQIDTLEVTIPANATGDGWQILATTANGAQVGISSAFSILDPSHDTGKKSMAIPIIGSVVAAVVVVSLLVFALFLYMRRRRQQFDVPEFNLEASFPPRNQSHQISRSFSSTSTGLTNTAVKSSQMIEMEKVEWETRLEEQFARARAATPDIPRSATPAPLSAIPPVPLLPQRGPSRNPSY